jgi:hypothetical protein
MRSASGKRLDRVGDPGETIVDYRKEIEADLRKLSRRAIVAFVARGARRAQPMYIAFARSFFLVD